MIRRYYVCDGRLRNALLFVACIYYGCDVFAVTKRLNVAGKIAIKWETRRTTLSLIIVYEDDARETATVKIRLIVRRVCYDNENVKRAVLGVSRNPIKQSSANARI